MDSCIAVNKKTADSLIKSSAIESSPGNSADHDLNKLRHVESSPSSADLNNTHTRLEDSFENVEDTEPAVSVSVSVRNGINMSKFPL